MARSRLTGITQDVVNDGGNILLSVVQGEQLEFPSDISNINDPTAYDYECVIIEADNQPEQTKAPTKVLANGVQNTINVRIPEVLGEWQSTAAYSMFEVVTYAGKYYNKLVGFGMIDSTPPDISPTWAEVPAGRIYIQVTSDLSLNYAQQPVIGSPVYGFLELRVSEKVGTFKRTWKPVRGIVEFLFSPTHVVPDVI